MYLESKVCVLCEEGIGISDSVEYLGIDVRNQINKLERRKKEKRKKVRADNSCRQENKGIQEGEHQKRFQRSLEIGVW